VEKRGLEIAGLESRSGLIMGDFTGNSGREGRRARQGPVNVGFSAFHEGRRTGKKTTPGGREKHAYFLERNSGKIGRGKLSDFL